MDLSRTLSQTSHFILPLNYHGKADFQPNLVFVENTFSFPVGCHALMVHERYGRAKMARMCSAGASSEKDCTTLWCQWIIQLTNTQRAFGPVAIVAHTLVTAECIFTRRVCSTPAVIVSTLVHVCKSIGQTSPASRLLSLYSTKRRKRTANYAATSVWEKTDWLIDWFIHSYSYITAICQNARM